LYTMAAAMVAMVAAVVVLVSAVAGPAVGLT
jgi:hypothetical protein